MDILLSIVGIVFAILQIMLFFKLWSMTNDVRVIKEKLLSQYSSTERESVSEDSLIGKVVVNLATEKQMKVKEVAEDGRYKCYSNNMYIGDFKESDIMEFDLWVKNK